MTARPFPTQSEDFNEWYNQLVLKAELADYAPVRGCMVVRPYGWALWENIQGALDRRFKATGHVNAGFPMFIPASFLEKEKEHVAGFAPELAIVTQAGGEELAEPIVVRPTSETLVGHMYAKWIQSYQDLPVLINLWNSVVRWEKRTKLFLRTTEFFWQEGHTAHATADEAEFETRQMLDVYTDFAMNEAALPVIPGRKSEADKFAGAQSTFSIEAMMGDGRALQSATSHNFGQNFSQAFDIKYLDKENQLQHCWTTSWGLSTRMIGAIVMAHGDDQGLVLPPRLAPYQIVIVPIYRSDEERANVLDEVNKLAHELVDYRVWVDRRDGHSPGYKFNDWEMRGVPLRIELGPRDIAEGNVVFARRDVPGRDGKQTVARSGAVAAAGELLTSIQASMYDKALRFRESHTQEPSDYDEFRAAVETGFASVWWCEEQDCEQAIQAETSATCRCLPLGQPDGAGVCVRDGRPASVRAIFARAY
ncbi:MAG TPA: proline--tRNA ligase [Dehalococcoidia bacterium]|nr:proline--tRNA ligase [Dehalococcoidia bacterium]